jgi:hypothetical protein
MVGVGRRDPVGTACGTLTVVSSRRLRIATFLFVLGVTLLAFAPDALAKVAYGGEGWYGETTDKSVTDVMFATIAFFPTLILVLSLIQWRLEKRHEARRQAAARRASNVDWRGGW